MADTFDIVLLVAALASLFAVSSSLAALAAKTGVLDFQAGGGGGGGGPVSAQTRSNRGTGSTSGTLESPWPYLRGEKNRPPWYMQWVQDTPQNVAKGQQDPDAIRVIYRKGSFGSRGGFQFKARPKKLLPADAATLSYEVYFPESFEFRGPGNEGGKLPGMCIGTTKLGCASGGQWSVSEGGVRLMWRNRQNAVAYVYPMGTSDTDAARGQGPEYTRNLKISGGHNLWRDGGLTFQKGKWNTVRLYVRLNTPGRADGVIELTVNGVTRRVGDARLRNKQEQRLNVIHFSTFFGGGEPFAPIKDVWAEFRRFSLAV